ncbi:MAG: M14 family metallopeptidase [Candidatus Eisenbacteria bacterium]
MPDRISCTTRLSALLAVSFALCLPPAVDFAAGSEPAAEDTFEFREFSERNPAIPPPEAVLGVQVGERPVRHAQVVRYLERLAESSPRMELREYGRSHEDRGLIVAVIGLPEHLARLDENRRLMDLLSDPRRLPLRREAEEIARELPAVAWMGYSVHGGELSSTDAALQLAYELASGEDEAVLHVLRNVVVLIDPLQNPDGRERYLAQIEFLGGAVPNPDPAALNHTAMWPWGRGNHYLFDMNRDWFAQVQPESRGRVAVIRDWKPQLAADSHEMKSRSTYLFPPMREPFNPHQSPRAFRWLDRFSEDHAAEFDRRGWSYYTREWNEEWFPGYGSSWPLYRGAIGILYEQSRTAGRIVKRPDGSVMTFRESVHHQLVSSLANLRTLADHRREILIDYYDDLREAVERGRRGPVRAFLLAPSPAAERLDRLNRSLRNQGIETYRAAEEFRANDLNDAWGGRGESGTLPKGTVLVRLDQPLEPLIRATMDFHTQMADSFLVSEREELETKNESRLYDITAWSVPLAYGIEAYWTGSVPEAEWEAEGDPPEAAGRLEGDWPAFGIVGDARQEGIPAAAAKLLSAGLSVRAAEEAFRAEGRDYPAGTLLLRRETNPDSLPDLVRRVAMETGASFRAVPSARAEKGPDLGGDTFRPLVEPRIAILGGFPVITDEYGSLWHLFDREMGIRVSCVDVSRIESTDLGRYNVLILSSVQRGPYMYERALGKKSIESIRRWVEEGGTLVGIHVGAAFLADSANALSAVRLRRQTVLEHPSPERGIPLRSARRMFMSEAMGGAPTTEEVGPPPSFGIPGPGSPVVGPGAVPFAGGAERRARVPEAGASPAAAPETAEEPKPDLDALERIDERLRRFRPRGAILRVDLNPRHWLAFGMPDRIPVPVSTSFAYLARDPVSIAGRFAESDSLHLSGLLWPEAAGRWERTAYLTREPIGNGQLILFADDPVFRGYWLGTRRLIQNAAILGPGMGSAGEPPYVRENR